MINDESNESSPHYAPSDGLLVIDGLTKKYGGLAAVSRLSFTVAEGEILGFIGPNGAGKSSTFNCITGVNDVSSGSIWYDEIDITEKPMYKIARLGIARTFQDIRLLDDLAILENIRIGMTSDSLNPSDIFKINSRKEKELRNIANNIGLGNDVNRKIAELPHADRIRVEIARALASGPDLLLIDEPFAGLSQSEISELATLFSSLNDDGVTLIIIDHNMRGLLELVDRVVVISQGQKIAEGDPKQIRENPKVQEAYLGSDDHD